MRDFATPSRHLLSQNVEMMDERSYISSLASLSSESEHGLSRSQNTQIRLPRETLMVEVEVEESLGSASNMASLDNSEISEPANGLDPLPNLPITVSQESTQEFQRQNFVELTPQTEHIEILRLHNSAIEHVEYEALSVKSKLLSKYPQQIL